MSRFVRVKIEGTDTVLRVSRTGTVNDLMEWVHTNFGVRLSKVYSADGDLLIPGLDLAWGAENGELLIGIPETHNPARKFRSKTASTSAAGPAADQIQDKEPIITDHKTKTANRPAPASFVQADEVPTKPASPPNKTTTAEEASQASELEVEATATKLKQTASSKRASKAIKSKEQTVKRQKHVSSAPVDVDRDVTVGWQKLEIQTIVPDEVPTLCAHLSKLFSGRQSDRDAELATKLIFGMMERFSADQQLVDQLLGVLLNVVFEDDDNPKANSYLRRAFTVIVAKLELLLAQLQHQATATSALRVLIELISWWTELPIVPGDHMARVFVEISRAPRDGSAAVFAQLLVNVPWKTVPPRIHEQIARLIGGWIDFFIQHEGDVETVTHAMVALANIATDLGSVPKIANALYSSNLRLLIDHVTAGAKSLYDEDEQAFANITLVIHNVANCNPEFRTAEMLDNLFIIMAYMPDGLVLREHVFCGASLIAANDIELQKRMVYEHHLLTIVEKGLRFIVNALDSGVDFVEVILQTFQVIRCVKDVEKTKDWLQRPDIVAVLQKVNAPYAFKQGHGGFVVGDLYQDIIEE